MYIISSKVPWVNPKYNIGNISMGKIRHDIERIGRIVD